MQGGSTLRNCRAADAGLDSLRQEREAGREEAEASSK